MRILLIQQATHPFRHVDHIERALERQGYLVEIAAVNDKADHRLRGADVIVLDLKFAGPRGLGLIREWRSAGVDAQVLVLLSPRAGEFKVEALDGGADAILEKPYDREELLAQIRAMTRRVKPRVNPKEGALKVFDLEINLWERVVKRAGRTIKLTRREYEVIHFLACHRGRVVTRAQIRAHLNGDGEANSNLIDVYIRYLRQKIDKDFEPPLILTCWGRGYLLRGDAELEAAG